MFPPPNFRVSFRLANITSIAARTQVRINDVRHKVLRCDVLEPEEMRYPTMGLKYYIYFPPGDTFTKNIIYTFMNYA